MPIRFLLFFLFFQSLFFFVHYYLYIRIGKNPQINPKFQRWTKRLLWFLGLSIPFGLFLSRVVPFQVGQYLFWLPFVWMGTITYPLLTLLFFDLIAKPILKIGKKKEFLEDPSKRAFFHRVAAGSAGLAAAGSAGTALYNNAGVPEVLWVTIKIPHLPPSFEGFKIAQISDIHIGRPMTGPWLAKVVEKVNSLGADINAVTGDFVDGSVANLKESVRPIQGLKAPSYFVTGNHEYYSGAEEWLAVFKEFGLVNLRNEHHRMLRGTESIVLAGVDDYKSKGLAPGHGPDLAKALRGVPENDVKILLAHQPKEIFNAAKHKVDLQISGHTHGGQLWPFGAIVEMVQPYNIGYYRHNERTQIYVNQGTGAWGPPMRLGTKNEITLITIQKT